MRATRASSGAARWIAFAPIHGRAECARAPSNVAAHVDRALAAGLDPAAGRLEQDREVAGDELGRARRTAGAARCARRRPLRPRRTRASRRGAARSGRRDRRRARAAPRARPSCRPSRGRAACRRRGAASRCRWRARCRGGRRARRAARAPSSVRATTLCADALDVERRRALAQPRLDEVGERGFVAAHRRDRAELLGEREQIGSRHETMPCSRRIALSLQLVVLLALGEVAQDQRARQAERAARELLHARALHDDRALGDDAARDLLAGLGVDDRRGRREDDARRRAWRPAAPARRRRSCSASR